MNRFLKYSLLFLVVAAAGCSRPVVKVQDIGVSKVSFRQMELDMTFAIHNPNWFTVPLHALEYAFVVGDQSLAKIHRQAGLPSIPAGETCTISLPLTLDHSRLRRVIMQVRGGDEVPFVNRIEATFKVLGMNWPVTMRQGGSFKAFLLPDWKLVGVRMRQLPTAALVLVFEIENPNRFALSVASLSGKVTLGGKAVLEIDQPSLADLPAGRSTRVEVPVRLRAIQLIFAVSKAIAKGQSLAFQGDFQLAQPVRLRDLFRLESVTAASMQSVGEDAPPKPSTAEGNPSKQTDAQ